jgi:transcriptional repressor NrdR
MKCPYCYALDSRVIDSRTSNEGFTIRRRRECPDCGNRFTTYEQVSEVPVMVKKKDASRVPFDREKIRSGLAKACYKRPVSPETIDDLATRIEAEITRKGDPEVLSSTIGEMVMKELRALDQVAYVRFASVYREFKDVSDFEVEIRPMLPRGRD